MTTTAAQQVALDNALVPLEKRVKIGKCNMRIDPAKTQKEPTYQVVLDALVLTTCYPAFLITADICPRLPTKEFDALHQMKKLSPSLRNLATNETLNLSLKLLLIICTNLGEPLQQSSTSAYLGKLQRSQEARKDVLSQIHKAIIHHFITKAKSISMRNKMFMHTAQDNSILVPIRFVSKSDDFQVYGALLPNRMANHKMLDSDAYKTYLAYTTGATSPKMKRKFKKPTSHSNKRTLVTIEEEEPESAKKDKLKKALVKAKRSKGIKLLSDAALLKETQLKKALKRSKRETSIRQAGGSSEGADIESEVPDEPKGKSIDTSDGTGLKPGFPDVSKDDEEVQESDDEPQHADDERTDSENQETNDDEEETEDEFIHTPPNYVPTCGKLEGGAGSSGAVDKGHRNTAVENVVENESHFSLEVVDQDLSPLVMFTIHLKSEQGKRVVRSQWRKRVGKGKVEFMGGIGGGSFANHSMVAKDSLGGDGFVIDGGRSPSTSSRDGEDGGVEN
ncbi:hypothetical protein Tco_0409981 [Tanacetum coccineum]